MKFLKKMQIIVTLAIVCLTLTSNVMAQKKYTYKSYPNDPLKARIYKLENGLTVYLSVYTDAPRIQTFIVTRAGSKNDPSDATGLAHYFEHMMFKGTAKFGTQDFQKEKVLIDSIQDLFEVYRKTKDDAERKKIYAEIDRISYAASKIAIPNEYDKLLSAIGAKGTNAYTSNEQTAYINDIPSNQLENWIKIESERFRNPVLRLFHTELETVYEEKNMTLANDARKANAALMEGLFKNHTYGTQTTIGTIEHLKNPSMKKIMEFYNNYYVPGNMAICLSGDFNPDEVIAMIDNTFGKYPAKNAPAFSFKPEEPITSPVIKEVVGPDAEFLTIGFRNKGVNTKEADLMNLTGMILSNGQTGLVDKNINQTQKALSAYAYASINVDYSWMVFSARPKQGQTLEQLKDLLLEQIEIIKKGDFPDWLVPAMIVDMKLSETKRFEENRSRAAAMVGAFVLGYDWENYLNRFNRLAKYTKQDIVDFAKNNFNNNYVIVYKRSGVDSNIAKITKPAITPIVINRDVQSGFLNEIVKNEVKDIQPIFLIFEKDLQKSTLQNKTPVFYKQNTTNETFELTYVFDMGTNHSKKFSPAFNYIDYLNTPKYTAQQIKDEFFKLGCSYFVNITEKQSYISLEGLNENFEKALELLEYVLANVQPNKEALDNLINDLLKVRKDAKLNKNAIANALTNYGIYGPENPFTYTLNETEIKALNPDELIAIIKEFSSYEHRIQYYGPKSTTEVNTTLNKLHKINGTIKALPKGKEFVELATDVNKIYHVNFPMKQVEITILSKGIAYDPAKSPIINLFNEYFGGSMNSLVFQELREAKALAYTARSTYSAPEDITRSYYSKSFIGTQTDKLMDAMKGLYGLMDEMPESEKAFNLAKNSIVQRMKADRITRTKVFQYYENAKKFNLTYDIRKSIYEQVPTFTFADIKKFQEEHLKNKKRTILLIGNKELLDFKALAPYGEVKHLNLEDIFGY